MLKTKRKKTINVRLRLHHEPSNRLKHIPRVSKRIRSLNLSCKKNISSPPTFRRCLFCPLRDCGGWVGEAMVATKNEAMKFTVQLL